MKNVFLSIMVFGSALGCALVPSKAEALKVKLEPSVTFRQSHRTHYQRPPRRVVQEYRDVYHYYDPYTGEDVYYSYPVTREYVEYYPRRTHSRGTDFQLKFKFK